MNKILEIKDFKTGRIYKNRKKNSKYHELYFFYCRVMRFDLFFLYYFILASV